MYKDHPNQELQRHFAERPFQGAAPEDARFLFVGLDANYAPDIESSPIFPSVLDYHRDGVAFWMRRGVHHPFLLPTYRGDGRRYHQNFTRIGLTPESAADVSFVELLHVPTTGRSAMVAGDLSRPHLDRVAAAILRGRARRIFVSASVTVLMRKSGCFPWLGKPRPGLLPVLFDDGMRTLHQHLHLSNYGKFQRQMEDEARLINVMIRGDGK